MTKASPMFKKYTFVLIALFYTVYLFAQSADANLSRNKINQLKIDASTSKYDTTKVRIYFGISKRYDQLNADSSLFFLEKAYSLARKIKYEIGIGNIAMELGNRSLQIGIYSEALTKYFESYDIGIAIQDTQLITLSLDNISTTYQLLDDHANRIKYAKSSIYFAKNITSQILSESILKDAYRHLGGAFLKLEKYDSALFYYNSVNEIALKYNDINDKVVSYMLLGEFHEAQKNYNISLEYYKKALLIYKEDDNNGILKFQLYNFIGNVYFLQNDLTNAYYYNRIAFQESERIGWIQGIESSSKSLMNYFKKINKYDSAYKYLDLYNKLKDSTSNVEKVRLIDNFSFEKKVAENEMKLKEHEEEVLREENIKLGLIAIFIPAFASFVFFLNRKKKKNTKIITILGLATLLMVFEFISLLIHPFVEKKTNHDPIIMYIVLILIASILVPLHHKLEGYVKGEKH